MGFGLPTDGKRVQSSLLALTGLPQVAQLADSPDLFAVVRPEVWPLIQNRYRVGQSHGMQRMLLDRRRFQPVPTDDVRRLGPADLPRLQALYADGEPAARRAGYRHYCDFHEGIAHRER